jgi:hypothetical protein
MLSGSLVGALLGVAWPPGCVVGSCLWHCNTAKPWLAAAISLALAGQPASYARLSIHEQQYSSKKLESSTPSSSRTSMLVSQQHSLSWPAPAV